MRALPLLVVLAIAELLPGTVSAEDTQNVAIIESIIAVNPDPDGKAYTLSIELQGGRQLSLQLRPDQAVKVVDGLSKTLGSGSQKQQVVAVVRGISIQADGQGKAVLLQPRTSAGPTEPLAIPIEGADRFLQLFQEKTAEARANAMKTQQK